MGKTEDVLLFFVSYKLGKPVIIELIFVYLKMFQWEVKANILYFYTLGG